MVYKWSKHNFLLKIATVIYWKVTEKLLKIVTSLIICWMEWSFTMDCESSAELQFHKSTSIDDEFL